MLKRMFAFQMRRCGRDDAALLSLLGTATFLQTYADQLEVEDIVAHAARHHSPEAYAGLLAAPENLAEMAILQPGRVPVGYTLCTAPDLPPETVEPGDYELRRIYLLHRFHGSGIGRALMENAIRNAAEQGYRRLTLGVYGRNEAAQRFYRSSGFRVIGERWFTVGSQTHHDHVMARELP